MKSEHAFALIALILGIVGGVLLFKNAFDVITRLFERRGYINVESVALAVIGLIAIIASAMIWTGRYLAGGVLNMVLGLITIFYGSDAEGSIVLISGILGIATPKIKD